MKKSLSGKSASLMNAKIPIWWLILLAVAAFLICLWGWAANIYALIDAPAFGNLEVARALGIPVFPLGVILGWFE